MGGFETRPYEKLLGALGVVGATVPRQAGLPVIGIYIIWAGTWACPYVASCHSERSPAERDEVKNLAYPGKPVFFGLLHPPSP